MNLLQRFGTISIAAFGLAGCGSKGEQKVAAQAPPSTVEVMQVSPSAADIYAEYPAQTYARNMVEVRGRVAGYIEKWLFRPGQEVQAGQALYVLDLRPFQAQLQQAQGSLQQTQADLMFAQRQVSLRQAEANLAAAQSNLVKAQQDYERLKPLVEQDAAARQDLDAAVAALRSAEASVRANQANVEQTRLSTDTHVQSTQGKVAAQRGAVETANLNLEYGTIRAPIGGLIGDTLVPVGGLVNPHRGGSPHHHRPARCHLGALQDQRGAIPETERQAGWARAGWPAAFADSGGRFHLPTDGQSDERAEPGGSAHWHAGAAGRFSQPAASSAARAVRPRALCGRASHRRAPGAAARRTAEPEHPDRLCRGREQQDRSARGQDRRSRRRGLA